MLKYTVCKVEYEHRSENGFLGRGERKRKPARFERRENEQPRESSSSLSTDLKRGGGFFAFFASSSLSPSPLLLFSHSPDTFRASAVFSKASQVFILPLLLRFSVFAPPPTFSFVAIRRRENCTDSEIAESVRDWTGEMGEGRNLKFKKAAIKLRQQ